MNLVFLAVFPLKTLLPCCSAEHPSRFCATATCIVSCSQLEPARVGVKTLTHRDPRACCSQHLLFNGPLTQLSVLCCDCSMLPVRCVKMWRQQELCDDSCCSTENTALRTENNPVAVFKSSSCWSYQLYQYFQTLRLFPHAEKDRCVLRTFPPFWAALTTKY